MEIHFPGVENRPTSAPESASREESAEGKGPAGGNHNGKHVGGDSPNMQTVEAVMREVAHSEIPILLLGERGTGKRAMARRIHDLSPRSHHSFRVLPCKALWPEVFELAGDGGFASPGTVYLDEIDDLNAKCQQRLLQVLSDGADGQSERRARLICGTARVLETEVRAGSLSEDLYYRVSGVCLHLPPLRQRREDIPGLMDHFLRKYADDFRLPIPKLSEETYRMLREYSWPGNLRELEDAAKAIASLGDQAMAIGGFGMWLRRGEEETPSSRLSLKEASRAASREAEKTLILSTLKRTRWNRRRAAEELQISYKALLYKLKQIGCDGNGEVKTP
jgi:two-component system, NtrC family, response regulator AtoC